MSKTIELTRLIDLLQPMLRRQQPDLPALTTALETIHDPELLAAALGMMGPGLLFTPFLENR